jgi:hypothetical protein
MCRGPGPGGTASDTLRDFRTVGRRGRARKAQ